MPVFVEDPSQFSKLRLKAELVAHNVALPEADSRKEVYLDLYLKHIGHKDKVAADFSSDEEEVETRGQDVGLGEAETAEGPEMLDPGWLTDDELKAALLKHGVKAGPIVASTRALYERKLQRLLQPSSQPGLNGTVDADAEYSDKDEEEEEEVEEEEQEDAGSQQVGQETVSHLDQDEPEESQEPLTDILTEMFPEAERTPTGIVATRRRPIKGAAGRPVQFKYPDVIAPPPLSPATLERQEVARRLAPLWVQVAVFAVIVCLLYLLYVCVEGEGGGVGSWDSPFASLLESLTLESAAGEDGGGGAGVEEELALAAGAAVDEAQQQADALLLPGSDQA